MKLKYLGHSAFYIEAEGLKALTDPFLDGNPLAAAKASDFTNLNYIFVTHGHGDHVGNAVEIAKRCGAAIICPTELAPFLAAQGVKTEGMQIGASFDFPFGKVKLTPALHGSAFVSGGKAEYAGLACGFLICAGGKKIYHAGDTALTMDMLLLAEENIDAALLPIGGYYTMDAEDAARAAKFVDAGIAIPMHYDTFPVIRRNPEDFVRLCSENDVCAKALAPGEEIVL